jgi:hypothetical protein
VIVSVIMTAVIVMAATVVITATIVIIKNTALYIIKKDAGL